MKRAFLTRVIAASIVVMALTGSAYAGDVTVAWDPNRETDIAGYLVWYGTRSSTYLANIDVGNRTEWRLGGLADGQRYFIAVQAYNAARVLSPLSIEIVADTPAAPQVEPPSLTPGGSRNAGSSTTQTSTLESAAGDYYLYHPVRGSWLTGWTVMAPNPTSADRLDVFRYKDNYREKIGEWLIGQAAGSGTFLYTGSFPEPNPPGGTDLAVWQSSTGNWYLLSSQDGVTYTSHFMVQWGLGSVGDVPVPADYDGDGKTDPAVWRAPTGDWYVLKSGDAYAVSSHAKVQWGLGSVGDIPVPGDYDGDGKADLAVWRAPTGDWYILKSSDAYNRRSQTKVQWGLGWVGDVPVPGDYDGDGKTDPAVWRAPSGDWFLLKSSDAYSYRTYVRIAWGAGSEGDVPVATDYDGDGKADLTVWRAPTGDWYSLKSSDAYNYRSYLKVNWGLGR